MELGSWSIIQAPSLLALIPLVVYIVLVFRGKNNVSGIIVGIFLAVLMLGQNLKAVSVGLAASLGSSTALIGIQTSDSMSKALSAREVISILMNRFGNEWKIFIPTIRTEMFLLAVSTTMYLLNNDGMDQLPYLQEQNTDKNPH